MLVKIQTKRRYGWEQRKKNKMRNNAARKI